MNITYDISTIPLLNVAILLLLLTVVSTRIYFKTNIKTDLYLTFAFALITIIALPLYWHTGERLFWSRTQHIALLSVLALTLAVYWLAEKRTRSESLPIMVLTGVTVLTLLVSELAAGFIISITLFLVSIWMFLQGRAKNTLQYVRVVFYVIISLLIVLGIVFIGPPAALLFSLVLVSLLLYEAVRYFDRVVNLLKNAGINSMTDALTGLFNKGFLQKKSAQLVAKQPISIIFCDIDNFKKLNDTMGHEHGDNVLIGTGRVIKELAKNVAYCCRYGGEEIVVISILPLKETAILAEKIREKVEAELNVTLSIGVANSTEIQDVPMNELAKRTVKVADMRMYQAKTTGKNKVIYKD
ncbi:diguanylate cyclase [Solibacillus sp. NPDC093137]|uniref:GGDEF domain-containing protein n=1 Tax=Solibacillus sp. NPDC093137 TaxID=3390678 RepID=UPI003CFFF3A5